jgi:hypothetical protein
MTMNKIEDYTFPAGLHLLTRWQTCEDVAKQEMKDVNGESQFKLVEVILEEVYKCPPIKRRLG